VGGRRGRRGEADLIRRFFEGVEKFSPQLVSWNGGGFDLPVLHHRAMIHGVAAPRYWDWGDDDRDFKFNNYLSRYHTRHIDLMDVLAAFQPRASAPLDAMAKLCGFPGKLGMDGSQVAGAVARGALDDVRRYCETDALNTYLLYQRFRLMRGELTAARTRRRSRSCARRSARSARRTGASSSPRGTRTMRALRP
jgi:predicted PolB exonuclease-like 3'-5' exonuclease